jgi:ABC-type polysaccharide/polyol phosphate transport system ATPase subunit
VPAILRKGLSKRIRAAGEPAGAADIDDDLDLDDEDDEEDLDQPRDVSARTIVALDKVSAVVLPGRGLAVVGPPQAGKSVLLRILTRVSPPTEGRATLRGRAAPMLELATAFLQANLSGEQNVRLLGQLFEVPREVIDRCLDDVLAFAGVGDERDVMLKHYSGGMSRRLALSAALGFEPDILLADETLGIGEASFREQTIARVEELLRGGTALVLATNDLALARRLCDEALWLERGKVVRQGPVEDVLREFEGALPQTTHGDGETPAQLGAVELRAFDGAPLRDLRADETGVLQVGVSLNGPVDELRCAIELTEDGRPRRRIVQPPGHRIEHPGDYVASVELAPGSLAGGRYEARAIAYVTVGEERSAVARPNALSFEVLEPAMDDEAPEWGDDVAPFVKDTATPWTILAREPGH